MSYTLLSERTHKARTPHRCIWCWQGIAAGELYINERSMYGGEFQHHHWHPECRAAMLDECVEEGGTIEWTPGQERPTTESAAT